MYPVETTYIKIQRLAAIKQFCSMKHAISKIDNLLLPRVATK